MVFFNNPHAAQAILESRQDRLQSQVAAERSPVATGEARKATVAPLPQTKPAAPAAAA